LILSLLLNISLSEANKLLQKSKGQSRDIDYFDPWYNDTQRFWEDPHIVDVGDYMQDSPEGYRKTEGLFDFAQRTHNHNHNHKHHK